MTLRTTIFVAATSGFLFAPAAAQAQDPSACWFRGETTPEAAADRPSPLRVTTIEMTGGTGQLCYSSPSARERVVMGELVPFGEIWRTGANEPTQLILPFDATIAGQAVEAGHYALYSIPGEDEWTFLLNPAYERWGIPVTDEVRAMEVAEFTRGSTTIEEMVESLTFRWESHGESMGHLVMEWENTRVEIPIHQGSMEHHDSMGHHGATSHAGPGGR